MLLGSNNAVQSVSKDNQEMIIFHLLDQNHYAEAYLLLKQAPAECTSTQYNLALCFYWAAHYREALQCLDRAQVLLPPGRQQSALETDSFYRSIRQKQNSMHDHRQAIIQQYVNMPASIVADGIIRLETDCWLALGQYDKVINTATPIAHKNYGNITEALDVAKQKTTNHE